MPEPPIQTLEEARRALAGLRAWVVTDGKMGDRAQCLGVAERLGLAVEEFAVAPRRPWRWGMPRLWRWPALGLDPAEAPGAAASPFKPPWPDFVFASGRRAVAYLPAIQRASGGRSFTICLKDPRSSPAIADFLWVPAHDRLRGANVLATLTSPHRLSPEALQAARGATRPEILALPRPRIAVLIGGDSKDFRFGAGDIERLASDLARLGAEGAGLMATASRRTSEALAHRARAVIQAAGGWFWTGAGPNPYLEMLANADALIVTAESVNMLGEAAATGRPVLVFRPTGGSRKIEQFLRGLDQAGVTRPFSGRLERYTYETLDSTPAIAIAIARRFLIKQDQEPHP